MKGRIDMKRSKKLLSIFTVFAALAAANGALAYEHPSWSEKDGDGTSVISVLENDGTWTGLPSWTEAYAALDPDSAPESVRELILIARRCRALEKMGLDPRELYADHLGAAFDPDMQ